MRTYFSWLIVLIRAAKTIIVPKIANFMLQPVKQVEIILVLLLLFV